MEFIVSASTDKGIVKENNQDSFGLKVLRTQCGKMVVAILCDGMGGLAKGEVASATVVDAFCKWILTDMPAICERGINEQAIRTEWNRVIHNCNERIKAYGKSCGVSLGTTISAILLTETDYYIVNVGDSRVYEITDQARILTRDQTVVAREVELGIITPEQAEVDPRQSVLLQCIGASDVVVPDYFFGKIKKDAVYMLCSDGFRHKIKPHELHAYLNAGVMGSADTLKANMDMLIELNKQRQERDNITVVAVRTY